MSWSGMMGYLSAGFGVLLLLGVVGGVLMWRAKRDDALTRARLAQVKPVENPFEEPPLPAYRRPGATHSLDN